MGGLFWRRKSQAPPKQKPELAPQPQSQSQSPFGAFASWQAAQSPAATQYSDVSDDHRTPPVPGAFPESPPSSPTLAPSDRHEAVSGLVDQEDGVHMEELASALPEIFATPELPTELGRHLHPRRPTHLTPSPTRVRRVRPVTPPHLVLEDEIPVDDPWSQQSLAYERLPFGRPVSAVHLFYPDRRPIPSGRIESVFTSQWQRLEKERKAQERDQRLPTRVIPKGLAVRPLSWEWLNRVSQEMKKPNNYKVAMSVSGDPISRRDIATCVTPLEWLNDEIINAYIALIIDYLRDSTGHAGCQDEPRYHAFNSFFYSSLRDKGYQGVRRWANRAKIGGERLLDVDTVFVPVHQSSHWTLLVVRPGDRTVEYFDSLGARGMAQFKVIKEWLRGELGARFDEDEWTLLPSRSSSQDNGSDCGAFLLSNAKAIAIGIDPRAFSAADINMLRKKIVAELINGGLRDEFDPIEKTGIALL